MTQTLTNNSCKSAQLQGVLFDLDGTLGDTLPICIAAFRAAIEPVAARTLSDAEIIATFGPSEEGTIYALAPNYAEHCLEKYLHHYETLHEYCSVPFDGIVSLLSLLKQRGVRLALVTGKGRRSAEISLRRFGLDSFFEYVETGSAHGPCKAAGIQKILSLWQLPPTSVVYVGDAPSDVTAARQAQVPIAVAAWASTADYNLLASLHPDVLCRTVNDLQTWLISLLVEKCDNTTNIRH